MFRRLLVVPRVNSLTALHKTAIRGGGGHAEGPRMIPFGRQPPFTQSIDLDADFVWNDGVSPEPAIDFDHADVPIQKILLCQGIMALFIFSVWQFAVYIDPEDQRPAAPRALALPTWEEMNFDDDHGRAPLH